jgi:hypothetical protein
MVREADIPLWIGNIVGVAGSCFAGFLIYAAPNFTSVLIRFILYLISMGCLIFFPHCLTHFVVGSLMGVHFKHYSLSRSPVERLGIPFISNLASKLPVLSIRIDRTSFSAVSRKARAAMFASGALCSMILPFVSVVWSLNELPVSLNLLLFMLCLGNLLFDVYYSPKSGDFSRIKLEKKPRL